MLKKEIRKIYKEKRQQLSHSEKAKLDDLLLIQFQQSGIEIPLLVMTYAGLEKFNEFDPYLITDYCHFKHPQVTMAYPVMNKANHTLQVVSVHADTAFDVNEFGIEEPVDGIPVFLNEIDMVLTPLLAFDNTGNRVGYGKGYYDRLLHECRNDCIKVGFSYFDPVNAIDDVNEHDIKLDYCITPGGIFAF
jgi:5-formyltetrahydrofolate cyclo-ligase